MFGGAIGNSGLTARRSNRGALRAVAAIFATALIVGACGGAAVTPSRGASPTAMWPVPTYAAWPVPTYAAWPSIEATPSDALGTPSPSIAPTPWSLGAPANFPIAWGKAPLAAPADDYGAAAATRINDFGLDLLRHLDSKGNLCASPTSIALALAMARAGARGATATEMDAVLRSLGASGQEAQIVALLMQLKRQTISSYSGEYDVGPEATPNSTEPEPLVELRIANQVFSQPGMTLGQAYLDSLSSSFGAGMGLLDFKRDPESARLIINKWASDSTRGRIPEALQSGDVTEDTRIAIANAIYLKAGWESPFDPADTKPRLFTTAAGARVNVPTMASGGWLSYAAGAGYRAVDLPLSTESLFVTIVVPDTMASFIASLTADELARIDGKMSTYDVDLTLPRFSVETRTDLADLLASMGMPTLFDPYKADLSGITQDERLHIYKIIHQANIDVVEEGVTAAAVTVALGMGGSSAEVSPPPHVQFLVNKPFLYFIRERESGVILFMGRVDDPSIGR